MILSLTGFVVAWNSTNRNGATIYFDTPSYEISESREISFDNRCTFIFNPSSDIEFLLTFSSSDFIIDGVVYFANLTKLSVIIPGASIHEEYSGVLADPYSLFSNKISSGYSIFGNIPYQSYFINSKIIVEIDYVIKGSNGSILDSLTVTGTNFIRSGIQGVTLFLPLLIILISLFALTSNIVRYDRQDCKLIIEEEIKSELRVWAILLLFLRNNIKRRFIFFGIWSIIFYWQILYYLETSKISLNILILIIFLNVLFFFDILLIYRNYVKFPSSFTVEEYSIILKNKVDNNLILKLFILILIVQPLWTKTFYKINNSQWIHVYIIFLIIFGLQCFLLSKISVKDND